MKERTVKNIMLALIILGVILVLLGIYLAVFTDISTSKGTDGIFSIVGFIAAGLFISIPAKIYLTVQMMKLNDEMLRAKNESIKNQ